MSTHDRLTDSFELDESSPACPSRGLVNDCPVCGDPDNFEWLTAIAGCGCPYCGDKEQQIDDCWHSHEQPCPAECFSGAGVIEP